MQSAPNQFPVSHFPRQPASLSYYPSPHVKRDYGSKIRGSTNLRFHPYSPSTPKAPSFRLEGSPQEKKRYKILNDLERAGLDQKLRELDKLLEQHPDDTKLALERERAMLMEARSCLQSAKDKLGKSGGDVAQAKKFQEQLRSEGVVKDGRIAQLQKQLESAEANLSTQGQTHAHQLERLRQELVLASENGGQQLHLAQQEMEKWKKRFDESQNKYAETLLKIHEQDQRAKESEALKIELTSEKGKVTALEGQLAQLKNEGEQTTKEREALEVQLGIAKEKASALEGKLTDLQNTNAQLQTQNTALQGTLKEREDCIRAIQIFANAGSLLALKKESKTI